MYILTDGKYYVSENPMKAGEYIRTTSPLQAKDFTYKQAKNLLTKNHNKKYSWIKQLQMINKDDGKEEKVKQYSNEGIYCDDKECEFEDCNVSVVEIEREVNAILNLSAWDLTQLNTYASVLNRGVQFYDIAISDVRHARMDKHPPANVMTKIDKLSNELEEKRRDIKQARTYANVMISAIEKQWDIIKLKEELKKSKYMPYKGRTKYFEMVEKMLKNY